VDHLFPNKPTFVSYQELTISDSSKKKKKLAIKPKNVKTTAKIPSELTFNPLLNSFPMGLFFIAMKSESFDNGHNPNPI
jgi:hypothetical protein